MKPLIINDCEETVPENYLEDWVKRLSSELSQRKVLPAAVAEKEISLVFLKEPDAKNLNWTHRQKDYATDILSFVTDDPESIGELVMCPMVLQKQAKENKKTYEEELGYMIVHGVLHLLGFDHEKSEEDERLMMKLQDDVFEVLIAPPAKKSAAKAAPKSTSAKSQVAKTSAMTEKAAEEPTPAKRGLKLVPSLPVKAKKPASKSAAPKKAKTPARALKIVKSVPDKPAKAAKGTKAKKK